MARTLNAEAVIVGLLAWHATGGAAQVQDRSPSFEVAVIKPSGPESRPMSINRLPDGSVVISNHSLPALISWAFNLDDGRLVGVPKGLATTRFDVVAKPPPADPARSQPQLMMRSLLAERFKLAVHTETRELTAYSLVTDSAGTKVRASASQEAPGPNPFAMSGSGTLTGSRVTTDMLAKVLSSQLGRPVENASGFTERFDFVLQWTPDAAPADAASQDFGSLFTAIREQLGFRLVARKMPVDVIVIDHVDAPPTAN